MPFAVRIKPRHDSKTRGGWTPEVDRRRQARRRAARHEAVSAQLIGGVDVKLCDLSMRGVMFESSMRVLVGAHVTLRVGTSSRALTLPGEVVRSRVSATRHGRLRYETALALAADCPVTNDELSLAPHEPVNVVDGVIDADMLDSVTLVNTW